METWDDEDWLDAEKRRLGREYLDVPTYNRDTWWAIGCLVAAPALVIGWVLLMAWR
jgi:hypothetical protein